MNDDQQAAYQRGVSDAGVLLRLGLSQLFIERALMALQLRVCFRPHPDEPPIDSYKRGLQEAVEVVYPDMNPWRDT